MANNITVHLANLSYYQYSQEDLSTLFSSGYLLSPAKRTGLGETRLALPFGLFVTERYQLQEGKRHSVYSFKTFYEYIESLIGRMNEEEKNSFEEASFCYYTFALRTRYFINNIEKILTTNSIESFP